MRGPRRRASVSGQRVRGVANGLWAQGASFELGGGESTIVTMQIAGLLRGEARNDPGIGYALAMGMVAIMGITIAAYAFLQRRAERWQR